jgi:apolipoprotein N-acyltransferase
VIVGPSGVLARYEKQHGSPIEPKRHERMLPGHAATDDGSISTVICVDLDYGDLVRTVASRGGLLAVPANDWPGYEALHHRAAVWAAVMSGTSVLRATGHGISAAYDPAGHVIAEQSSLSGPNPVVLVAEVPI